MTDYTELVKALRCMELRLSCNECAYGVWSESSEAWGCEFERKNDDAAAAIEALEKALIEENEAEDDMYRIACEKQSKIEELQAEVAELKRVNMEIFEDLPKRGEWITIRLNNGGSYTGCSCCEAPIPTDTMLDYIPESESKYCYSCGAKMEVRDETEI